MNEWVHCHDEAANHQLPIAAAFWIIWIVSMEESSNLTQNLMQIRCSTHSVILNVMSTQYTCSLNSIYCPPWLVERSHHCSHMCIPVHCPWLPGYINVTQTVLIILTMAGLFLERSSMIYLYKWSNWPNYLNNSGHTEWSQISINPSIDLKRVIIGNDVIS